ncbi:MAG: hypothetical protein R3B13_23705 [Polyangiaceae bacterium]
MRRFALIVLLLLVGSWLASCDSSVDSPFSKPGNEDAGSEGGGGTGAVDGGPILGAPCEDDKQCDDEVDCTFDECDLSVKRCRHTPDPTPCQNDVHCDGSEICDPQLGCRPGQPVACSDNTTCTIDRCIEATQTCAHDKRDADEDGDPDWGCGGTDCNDTNAEVSGKIEEVCGNEVDDDCDQQVDESDCVVPKYDDCVEPLEITASGQYSLSLAGLDADFAATCSTLGATSRDAVLAVIVPPGPARDVDIVATSQGAELALAATNQCGSPSGEFACHQSVESALGGQVARLLLRTLPPGPQAILLFGDAAATVDVKVTFLPASTPPTEETCGTAVPITPGVNHTTYVVGAFDDLASECPKSTGELVYQIDLPSPKDVHARAVSIDGIGNPSLALWQSPCSAASDEIVCSSAEQAHAFARGVGPGTVYLAVAATAPTVLDLLVTLEDPTPAPTDDSCVGAPAIPPFSKTAVSLQGHVDAAKLGCLPGAVDAAFSLDLSQTSDVMLVNRISDDDTAAVALALAPCSAPKQLLECTTGDRSPVRVARHALAAGSYRAVVESVSGSPMELSALTRAAVAPVFVAFGDTCDDAPLIPETGGFFQGNTANASPDYSAGCDFAPGASTGAPEQMLKLVLTQKRRVVLDMRGSGYTTLLDVRKGPSCPGTEIVNACAAGYVVDKSFLDLTLEPGAYFVQVDGYSGDAGPWFLDVFVGPP